MLQFAARAVREGIIVVRDKTSSVWPRVGKAGTVCKREQDDKVGGIASLRSQSGGLLHSQCIGAPTNRSTSPKNDMDDTPNEAPCLSRRVLHHSKGLQYSSALLKTSSFVSVYPRPVYGHRELSIKHPSFA